MTGAFYFCNIMRIVLKVLFLLLLTVPSARSIYAHSFKVSNRVETKILQYFQKRISGDSCVVSPQRTLKLSDVPAYRQIIWKLWVKSNTLNIKNPFHELHSLDMADTISWQIPDSLEPHAAMTFYMGTKGNIGDDQWPMFLYLHGSGPKAQEWATGLRLCKGFEDAPSAYFIPRIPNEGNYYRWWQRGKQYVWKRLLRQAMLSGNIDANRIYIFGISEGGYGSQRLASFYADYLAAAGPMAGGEPLINAPAENCSNIGFSLLTGSKDDGFYRNRLTAYTHAAFDSLQHEWGSGFIHRIELIPGAGHGIDYRLTTPWLKKFVRNPYPKSFIWENFAMDGIYRDGFYNLQVIKRSDKGQNSRTCYKMNITNNVVNISVDVVDYQTTEIDSIWGIALKFKKTYQKADYGKFIIYLSDDLVDLSKPVQIVVNGKLVYNGKLIPNIRSLINSCELFSDPCRLYPVSVNVDLERLNAKS